jgi:hypothetical protein
MGRGHAPALGSDSIVISGGLGGVWPVLWENATHTIPNVQSGNSFCIS